MPIAPMATGTPTPSTLAWTAIRSSTGSNWKIALIDPRVTPSVNERSTIRAVTTSVNKSNDVAPGPSGIRAQALAPDGTLLDDFVFHEADGVLHVRNAPSPGATSAFAIARVVVDRSDAAA